jgi:hypothetical protein
MNFISKKLILTTLLFTLLSLNHSYSQSESEKIKNLIEQKRDFNKKNTNSTVYKIQIYNGNETEAYKIERECKVYFPEYKTSTKYKNPEWKTQIGPFKTRLEADRALLFIKEKYSGAIVLEDKI